MFILCKGLDGYPLWKYYLWKTAKLFKYDEVNYNQIVIIMYLAILVFMDKLEIYVFMCLLFLAILHHIACKCFLLI